MTRGSFGGWQFSAGVLAPAVLCLVVTAAVVGALVFWSAGDIDRQSLERQTRLVAHVIEQRTAAVSREQESIAIWDDAVVAAKLSPDPEWLHNNLGGWMYEYFGHDRVFVLDAQNRPVYAMDEGQITDLGLYDADAPMLAPLLADIRRLVAGGGLTRYHEGGKKDYPRAADVMVISGSPAIVSALPIATDTGKLRQETGTEYLHVSIVFLDAAFASGLAEDYRLEEAAFTHSPVAAPNRASHPVTSNAGRYVAFFEWAPYRPGRVLLGTIAPALAGAFVLAGLLVVLLLGRLWRSSATLEAERLAAEHQATHDSLTGLANRGQFEERLGRALGRSRLREQGMAVLMLDLDRFKQVNDTLGHEAGDDLIRSVGQRLASLIGPADTLARLGGDEFAILRAASTSRDAEALSQQIIDAVGKPFDLLGSEVFVGVSLGIVVVGPDDTDRREVTRKADIALYEAKAAGRNRAVIYREAMNDVLQNRHTIESELREALRQTGQLTVAFQPLFSARGGAIVGAEARARWTHPTLGQVSPALFIPVAEATGLIEPIGEYVLREACSMGARWPGRTIAVNISPTQLRNPRFPVKVFALLAETGMQAADLELEITEGILLDNDDTTGNALATLRDAGIRIALDDFGTGYSSLNYLKRYPVDRIKIDRSFVSQLAPDSSSAAIVQAMVTLAHALGIQVTAEGVETHEQMTILRTIGCNTFQGFLLSAPLAPDLLENKLRKAAAPSEREVA